MAPRKTFVKFSEAVFHRVKKAHPDINCKLLGHLMRRAVLDAYNSEQAITLDGRPYKQFLLAGIPLVGFETALPWAIGVSLHDEVSSLLHLTLDLNATSVEIELAGRRIDTRGGLE